MSDRLQQLRRQRALVAEHLAWLDREIDRALEAPAPVEPITPPPADDLTSVPFSMRAAPPVAAKSSATPVAAPRAPSDDAATAASADAILRDYQVEPDTMKSDVKKGCLLYFFGALVLVALGVAALYFFFQHGR
ncbi:MAG: hypothetical protein HZA93_06995 [Verrucomicrobia bacterium]|nr:hypothetical protein [Verrucomicrobiota bacterium]